MNGSQTDRKTTCGTCLLKSLSSITANSFPLHGYYSRSANKSDNYIKFYKSKPEDTMYINKQCSPTFVLKNVSEEPQIPKISKHVRLYINIIIALY